MVAIYLLKATILVLRNPFSLIMLKCGMPLKKNQKAKIYKTSKFTLKIQWNLPGINFIQGEVNSPMPYWLESE